MRLTTLALRLPPPTKYSVRVAASTWSISTLLWYSSTELCSPRKALLKLSFSTRMSGLASSTMILLPFFLALSQSASRQARSYGPGGQR